MNKASEILNNESLFLNFYRERYPFFTNSNIFFRDVQYSVIDYLKRRDINVKYLEAEKITEELLNKWQAEGFLTKIDRQTWKVNKNFEAEEELTPEDNSAEERNN